MLHKCGQFGAVRRLDGNDMKLIAKIKSAFVMAWYN